MNAQDTIRRMAEANPVPDAGHLHTDPADAERLFSSIERRRDEMIGTHTRPTPRPAPPPPPRPWYRRPAVVFLMAIAAVMVVAVPLVIFTGGGSDVAETPATTVPVPEVSTTLPPTTVPKTTVPSTTLLPPTDPPVSMWSRVDVDGATFGSGSRVTELIPFDSGLVAVGYTGTDSDIAGAIWESEDGSNWSQVDSDFGTASRIADVASLGGELFAVGLTDSDEWGSYGTPAVWKSANGRTWSSVPLSAAQFPAGSWISDIAAGQGLVITGTTPSPPVLLENGQLVPLPLATVWFSVDGNEWHQVDFEPSSGNLETDSCTEIIDVAAGGLGYVAVGRVCGETPQPDYEFGAVGAIWTSPDGQTWPRAPLPAASPFDAACVLFDVTRAAAGPGGIVVAGLCESSESDEGAPTPVLLTSTDGLSWTWSTRHIGPDSIPIQGWIYDVAATETGFVGVGGFLPPGNGPEAAAFWHSSDGLEWTFQEEETPGGSYSYAAAVAAIELGDDLIAIGVADDRVVAWMSHP